MSFIFKETLNTRSILDDNLKYIRSDVPTKVSEEERQWLIQNDVVTIVDLRTEEERKKKNCPLQEDDRFSYFCMPVTGGNDIPKDMDDVSKSYINMVDASLYRTIDFIINANSNVLYFCNAGKDRTGVVSAILLHKEGKSLEYIVDDYMKSKENLKSMLENFASQNPLVDIAIITPCERYMKEFMEWFLSNKEYVSSSKIGSSDGPTSVFVLKKNAKLTLKQKIQKIKYNMKKAHVEKMISSGCHTLDEVMDYIVNVHGFIKVDAKSDEAMEEYNQMRASFLIRYAPKLLGEYETVPQLESSDEEKVREFIEKSKLRIKKAMEVPVTEFDIDFYKFTKSFGDSKGEMHIIIEKKYGHIGGGASGKKKMLRKFDRIQKDIFRYYGVSKEDIESKSKRYKDLVRALSR